MFNNNSHYDITAIGFRQLNEIEHGPIKGCESSPYTQGSGYTPTNLSITEIDTSIEGCSLHDIIR